MGRLRRKGSRKKLFYSDSQHYPEFFRIYLPEHNSKALCIPSSFIDNFNGNIPKKVILTNAQGKSWYVELEEIGGKLLISKGWEGYVRGHSLVRGDFLIFRYNGNGLFTVKVFGLNGCQKDEIMVTNDQLDVKVESSSRSEQIASDHTGTSEQKVEEEARSEQIASDHTGTSEKKVEGEARSEQIAGDHTGTYEQKHSESRMVIENRHPPDSCEAMKPIPERTEDSHSVRFSSIPERTEQCQSVRFTKVLDRKRRYEMGIPFGFITKHKIQHPKVSKPETIILRDQRGDPQRATFRRRADGRVEVARGWRDFCLYNHIVLGDMLEFKIVLDKQRKVREIVLLQINHKQEENRPH